MGSGTKKSTTALLIVDMISDFSFEGGSRLAARAVSVARAIAVLRNRLEGPTIFVNDNFHHWHATFESILDKARSSSGNGRSIAEILDPGADDYFILKPHQSGFYQTALEALLRDLEIGELIIAGITTDMCVLATAIEAYIRGYKLRVPKDCCTSFKAAYHNQALDLLARNYSADISASN